MLCGLPFFVLLVSNLAFDNGGVLVLVSLVNWILCLFMLLHGRAVAESLFTSFQWGVQSLESTLRKHKHYAARLKKLDDTAQLYAMVRRDPPAQVDVMFQETVATVSHVCEDETALELDADYRWNSELPVFHQGRTLSLGHAEPDKLWVDQVEGIHSGDSIVQPCGVGRVEDLFEAFATQWKQRWSRHAQVPAERWQVILDFARRFLRPVPAAHLHLTPTLLRAVTASKKKKAATGLHDTFLLGGLFLLVTLAGSLRAFPFAGACGFRASFCTVHQWGPPTPTLSKPPKVCCNQHWFVSSSPLVVAMWLVTLINGHLAIIATPAH